MLEVLAVFALTLALGLAGAAPAVTFGDAGEFSACAAILGLAHAPDYPLYALLGKAFGSGMRLGSWAYRTNALSASCAAAAMALLVRALRRCGFSTPARWAAAGALALSPLWRYESGVTEVFAPHLLALCALLWLACREGSLWKPRAAAAAGLAFGLGAANHQTIVLALPALLAQAWAGARPSLPRAARAAGLALVFAALGLSLYAYLPVRSARRPPLDWGAPTTPAKFWHAVLRKDYGSLSLTVEGRSGPRPAGRVLGQARRWAACAAAQLGWPFLLLAGLGLWAWPAAGGISRWLPLTWTLACGPFFLWLGNPPYDAQTSYALERFYLASWLGLALLAAGGIEALRRRAPLVGFLAAGAAFWAAAQPAAWAQSWARSDFASYDYGRNILRSLPKGAVLFMDGGDDTFYSLAFLRYAQGLRPDLQLHDRGGLVFPSAYGESFRRLGRAQKEPARRAVEVPLAASGRLFYSTLNERVLEGFSLEPWGLLRRPLGPARAAKPDLWQAYALRFEPSLLESRYRDRALAAVYPFSRAAWRAESGDLEGAYADLAATLEWAPDALWTPSSVGYAAGMLGYAAMKTGRPQLAVKAYELWTRAAPGRAEPLLNWGVAAEKAGLPGQAERLYARARAVEPSSAKANYNLGAIYWGQGRWAEAADAFEAALRLEPANAAYARFAAEARQRRLGGDRKR